MILYKIRDRYSREHSMYYYVNELKLIEQSGNMFKVYDIHDGFTFWIEAYKLEVIES